MAKLILNHEVKDGEFYVVNGRLFRWNATKNAGELIQILDGTN